MAKVGLLATRGHSDTIFHLRAGARLKWIPSHLIAHFATQTKRQPMLPKNLGASIDERVIFNGAVLVELNEDAAREAIRNLLDQGAEAIAIWLVWSTANPAHEQRLREIVHELAPPVFVSIPSEVTARRRVRSVDRHDRQRAHRAGDALLSRNIGRRSRGA